MVGTLSFIHRSYQRDFRKNLILFSRDKGIKINIFLRRISIMKGNYSTPDLRIMYIQESDIVTASAQVDPTQDDSYGLFIEGGIE
jgi:hypothetical protein